MLTPSMSYEVGKGRQFELEQKAAQRRQVEEALASQRLEQPSLLDKIAERLKETARVAGRRRGSETGMDLGRSGVQPAR
jgi:hypothetical protein